MSSNCGIDESWILLDSQSTIDVFSNPSLLVKKNTKLTPHYESDAMQASTQLSTKDTLWVTDGCGIILKG